MRFERSKAQKSKLISNSKLCRRSILNCKTEAIRSRWIRGENSRRRGCRSGPPTLVVDSCTRKRQVGTGRQKMRGEQDARSQKGRDKKHRQRERVFAILVFWSSKSKYCVDKYVTLRRLCRVYKQSAVKGLCIVDFDDDLL